MPDLTDPAHALSPSLGRRAFVGLSAGASAFGGAALAAFAQSAELGKPHPPLVSEVDPAIVALHSTISYAAPGGERTLDAYIAEPKDAGPATPALVVVQAIWGVDAQLRDTVRRLAKAGFIAVAPDLYTGLAAPNGDGATDFAPFRDIAAKLSDDVVDADLAAAAKHVRTAGGSPGRKVGVMGFCMGGAITLRQAVDNAARFAAAVVFYGKVRYGTTGNQGTITPIALDYADHVGVPLAGNWGQRDTSILAADVTALDGRLTELAKAHDFKIYPEAGHAFFDDTRDSYVATAASDAWTRTLSWFGRHLT